MPALQMSLFGFELSTLPVPTINLDELLKSVHVSIAMRLCSSSKVAPHGSTRNVNLVDIWYCLLLSKYLAQTIPH